MKNVHDITKEFEQAICDYTGAPYCVAVDNCSNSLFLALTYDNVSGREITIPAHTYPAVPCEIVHAGGKVRFLETSYEILRGAYLLEGSRVVDSALRFTADMFHEGYYHCLSFTGAYKHLKLGKGGAILTDNEDAYKWFKKARFSGRAECSYHDDDFDLTPVVGWNFYMMPEIAARGLLLIQQFYNGDGSKKNNPDLELKYPDLSKFKLWK